MTTSAQTPWGVRFSPADLAVRPSSPPGPATLGALYLRIAALLTGEIRRGRIHAGQRLPSSRHLARMLEVNRNTVVAAYDELASEGWITTRPATGAFVCDRLPELPPRRFAAAALLRTSVPARPGFDLRPLDVVQTDRVADQVPALPAGGLGLWGGYPDLSSVPVAALARAYRRALRGRAANNFGGLEYTDGRGHPRLRAAIASMLSATRGVAARPDDVMVTRGSQMAVGLVARALLHKGDAVAVEELGYARIWSALQRAGATLVPIPVDGGGMDVGALAALAARRRLRAVYLTPHHQYPSTVVLAPERRIALLDLARRQRMAIIEDDYDHEFHFDGQPVMPLAAADPGGTVIYVGTFSKILAPGLRLGLVVAPPPLLARLLTLREEIDRQGDTVLELAVAELIEDGELQRHAGRMRRIYRVRRDALVGSLQKRLPGALTYAVPPGGMSLWARASHEVDVERWRTRSLAEGTGFMSGRSYVLAGDGRGRGRWSAHLRLGYGRYEASSLDEAVRRMKVALDGLR